MGDFNAHVGNISCGANLLDTATCDSRPPYTLLSSRFTRCLSKIDARGRSLARFVEDNGLIMLNGRSYSDRNGCTTFSSRRSEKRVATVIDYVLADQVQGLDMHVN